MLLEQRLYELPGEPIASLLLATAFALQGNRGRSREVIRRARIASRQIGDRESVSMLQDMESMINTEPAALLVLFELMGLPDGI
jgi:hypothetical protein